MKKNIKEIKKNRKKKKKKPWAATTICSKFTFFSVLLPDKALIKTAMCSVKLVLVLVTSLLPRIHLHDGFTVPTHSLTHTNTRCHYCFPAKLVEISLMERTASRSTFVSVILITQKRQIHEWIFTNFSTGVSLISF